MPLQHRETEEWLKPVSNISVATDVATLPPRQ
uniref:Uncharacterized protein n=1 Tax=Mesocestoides corti TaxID=53468 RepID=A0A5K3FLH0_MESCO